jgi:putative inorganic carbon (hco3(-)) transporter
MRDALLLVILVITCFYSAKKPWVGVMAWTAVSLGSPHVSIGYAAGSWPVASAVGGWAW